jgi:hypothetical protein
LLVVEGVEADDVLATLAHQAEAAGMRSTLMTIADECVALYERVIDLVPEWKALPKVQVEPWSRLGVR